VLTSSTEARHYPTPATLRDMLDAARMAEFALCARAERRNDGMWLRCAVASRVTSRRTAGEAVWEYLDRRRPELAYCDLSAIPLGEAWLVQVQGAPRSRFLFMVNRYGFVEEMGRAKATARTPTATSSVISRAHIERTDIEPSPVEPSPVEPSPVEPSPVDIDLRDSVHL
jgi:hypothetical protein